ncbi:hypothetical protein OKW22_001074 [Bacilli bacterium PM5-3]|nr:hypothetical protein [Bacilli bacterium PM5-3]MDH6603462.1 hypothetical protein [Bacilli bacterium PM5-9]
MKKTKKIILSIVIIVLCLVIWIFGFSEYGSIIKYWYIAPLFEKQIENFDENKNDYQLIVDRIIKSVNEEKIMKDESLVVEGNLISSTLSENNIELTDTENRSLENIKNTFVGEFCAMDKIKIETDNFIKFTSFDCNFGVVYSKDGNKPPSSVDYEDFIIEYKIKKLAPNWYTVEEK